MEINKRFPTIFPATLKHSCNVFPGSRPVLQQVKKMYTSQPTLSEPEICVPIQQYDIDRNKNSRASQTPSWFLPFKSVCSVYLSNRGIGPNPASTALEAGCTLDMFADCWSITRLAYQLCLQQHLARNVTQCSLNIMRNVVN